MDNKIVEEINALVKSKKVKAGGIGKKIKNGKVVNDTVVTFFVDKKKDKSEIPNDEMIPKEVEVNGKKYNTDIVELTEIRPEACFPDETDSSIQKLRGNPTLLTPLKGGQEVWAFPTFHGGGTLGFFAVDDIDGLVVGVTNAHVALFNLFLASQRDADDDDEPFNIVEPRPWPFEVNFQWIQANTDYNPGMVVREGVNDALFENTILNPPAAVRLKRYVPINKTQINYVDAALLVMDPSYISNESYQIHQPNDEPDYLPHLPFATTAEIDDLVSMDPTPQIFSTGRTTGPKGWSLSPSCRLVVTSIITSTVNVTGVGPFSDLLIYRYEDSVSKPTNSGDSGSAVVADISGVRKIIALHFAGNDTFGFGCRIDRLAEELKIRAWDSEYALNTTVPTPVVKVVPQNSALSGQTSAVDDVDDAVYQAGITKTTTFDEL